MGGKSTPLNDFFRGRHVDTERSRAQTPLLCDKLGIVWVVGHRISERVKVTEADEPNAGPAVGTPPGRRVTRSRWRNGRQRPASAIM